MANDVENPMVTGAGYAEPEPDFTCPHCGSKWWNDDITEYSVSAKRQYCGDCVETLDTNERREEWFEGNDKQNDKLLIAYLVSPHSTEKIADGVDAKALCAWAKQHDADGYADALHDYIHVDTYRHQDYRQWLMDNN